MFASLKAKLGRKPGGTNAPGGAAVGGNMYHAKYRCKSAANAKGQTSLLPKKIKKNSSGGGGNGEGDSGKTNYIDRGSDTDAFQEWDRV